MNGLAIPIVHPAFENLKRFGRFLHLVAGLIIITNAITQLREPELNQLYFWCQLIIGIDILILVFTTRNLVVEMPKINLIFRFIEATLFLGVAASLIYQGQWITGITLFAAACAYGYLFYCEKKVGGEEMVAFHHTGITVSDIPEAKFFIWTKINSVEARYDAITIHTSENKSITFDFRKNLQFEELEQIHEFCRHYVGK